MIRKFVVFALFVLVLGQFSHRGFSQSSTSVVEGIVQEASGVWELPVGKGKRYANDVPSALNHVIGGWTMDAIATFSQGFPYTVLAASSTSVDPMTNYRADQLCDGRSTLKNKNVRSNGHYWFDTSCFAKPKPNYFGTQPRTSSPVLASITGISAPGNSSSCVRPRACSSVQTHSTHSTMRNS